MTVIIADPPYSWNDKLPGDNRGADEHLIALTTEQIQATALPRLDPDSVLFLWRPASRLQDSLKIAEAWGFTPKTEMVWVKTTVKGNRHMGMGRIVRGEHESVLIATRGKPSVSVRNIRSTFTANVVPYGKPPEFYEIVRELYPDHTHYERTAKEWRRGWALVHHPRSHAPAKRV